MIFVNDDSMYVGQIKQILSSFNLPRCGKHVQGRYYLAGQHYIRDGWLYSVTKSGKDIADDVKTVSYSIGDEVPGITGTLQPTSSIYDSKTHAYLGNYLRFLRDFVGIDLMGLYNCNAYDMPGSMSAKHPDYSGISFSTDDSGYFLMMVPVRWGMKYTVAIDWHGPLEMACAHFGNGALLDRSMIEGTYKKVSGPRFNHPFIYEPGDCPDLGDDKESELKLFFKIPASCTSSLVVLEGDFTKCSSDNMYMADNASMGMLLGGYAPSACDVQENDSLAVNCQSFDYVTKNQLLSMNLGSKALLADRLVEYLSLQVVSPMDDILTNMKRLQRTLLNKFGGYSVKEYGRWDDSMREAIYRYLWSTGLIHKKEDLLAYFDKDVERSIGGLASLSDSDGSQKTFAKGTVGGK